MILKRAKETLNFPYGMSNLRRLLKEMDFKYKKYERRSFVMESSRIRIWRYKYLQKITKARESGKDIIYLDETWYDSHDGVRKGWTDDSKNCIADTPASRGKRLIILHAGSHKGWVDNCLLVSCKDLKKCNADYHEDMTADLFEGWFQRQLMPALTGPAVIVMDNASYHSM